MAQVMLHQDVDEYSVELPAPGVLGEEIGVQLQPNADKMTSYTNSQGGTDKFVDVPYQTFHIDPVIWQQYSDGAKAMYICYNTCMREVADKGDYMPLSDLVCNPGMGTVFAVHFLPCALSSCIMASVQRYVYSSVEDRQLPDHNEEALVLTDVGIKGYSQEVDHVFGPFCCTGRQTGNEPWKPVALTWDNIQLDRGIATYRSYSCFSCPGPAPHWYMRNSSCDKACKNEDVGAHGEIKTMDSHLTCTLGFGLLWHMPCCRMALCTYHIPEYYSLHIPSKSGNEVITVHALQEDADRVLSLIYDGLDRAAAKAESGRG